MLKFLWNGVANQSGTPFGAIPTYQQGKTEDRVDLQVKSLGYMYRRCNVGSLSKQHTRFASEAPTTIESQKLDYMYNIQAFEHIMNNDEHRVLIDWYKNKFRSLCILSGQPKEISTLPKLGPGFKFVVLSCDASNDDYISTLSQSDIYLEHQVGMDTRRRIIKSALELVKGGSQAYSLTKDERAWIILYYLNKVAVEVQVERLYRGTLSAKMSSPSETRPPVQQQKSPSPSPSSSPTRKSPRKVPQKLMDSRIPLPSAPSSSSSPKSSSPRRAELMSISPKKHESTAAVSSKKYDSSPHTLSQSNSPQSSPQKPRKMKSASALGTSVKRQQQNGQLQSSPPPPLPSNSPKDHDSRPTSPVRQYIESPPSNAVMVAPARLLKQQKSIPNMKLSSASGSSPPPPVPDLPPSPTKSNASSSTMFDVSEDEHRELRSQARIAVKNRLDRERQALRLLLSNK